MRRIIPLLAMLAVSCAAAGRITDVFGTIDRKAPEVVSYRLETSGLFTISYDEDVTIEEALIGGSSIDIRGSGRDFSLVFPVPLAMGHEYTLFIMAEDAYGNTLRTAFFLTGPNDDVPYTVINEIAPEAPDRVELLVMEDGNTAGMVLKDGTDGDFNGRFLLPDLEVKANDIILIYWNGKADEESRERETLRPYYALKIVWLKSEPTSSQYSALYGKLKACRERGTLHPCYTLKIVLLKSEPTSSPYSALYGKLKASRERGTLRPLLYLENNLTDMRDNFFAIPYNIEVDK